MRPTRDIDGYPSAGAGVTDNNGRATLTLTVNDGPPSRTSQPDGLLYFIVRYLGAEPPDLMQAAPRKESMISAVVYAPFPYPNPPAWETVKELMTPNAKLYPGMTEQIDLTQQLAFFTFATNPPWLAFDGPNALPSWLRQANGVFMLGGRQAGLHQFKTQGNNFPQPNQTIRWADLESGSFRPLLDLTLVTPELAAPLSATDQPPIMSASPPRPRQVRLQK